MSKEFDNKLLYTLKELCENAYHRPTDFDLKLLEEKTGSTIFSISHAINNLQREGHIRIHMGLPGEMNKFELLKS